MAKKEKIAKNMLKIGDQEIPLTVEFLEDIADRIIYDLLDDSVVYNKVTKVFTKALLAYLEKNIKLFDSQFKDLMTATLEDSIIDIVSEDAPFDKMISDRVVALRNEVLAGMSDNKIKKLILKRLSN